MRPAIIVICIAFVHIGGQLLATSRSTVDFWSGIVLSAIGAGTLGLVYAVRSRGLER